MSRVGGVRRLYFHNESMLFDDVISQKQHFLAELLVLKIWALRSYPCRSQFCLASPAMEGGSNHRPKTTAT